MSHRGGSRGKRPPADLVIVGATVLCPRCRVQVARTQAAKGERWQMSFPSPRLLGTGWHIIDGVWWLEGHGKARLERGGLPHPAHRRGQMRIYSEKIGADPVTDRGVVLEPPELTVKSAGAPEAHIASGGLVACPSCDAISRWNPEVSPGSAAP